MDVLSGALTGSSVGTGVHGPYEPDARSGAGHLFLALEPAAFGDPAGYAARVEQLIAEVKAVPLAQGFDEVFYPGEVEDRAEAATLAAGGIQLAEQSLADLLALGTETGVAFPGGSPA
jgi:LDH2 family malate/lactate/ureidoglycolate dehydrogenase